MVAIRQPKQSADERARNRRRRRATGPLRALLARATLTSLLLGTTPGLVRAHPIHTTLAEITVQRDGTVRLLVRTFVDDFSTAVARFTKTSARADHVVADADAGRYVSAVFTVTDARGVRLPLTLVSQRRTEDVVWLELTSTAASLKGAKIRNAMLFEVHPDQVNIVKATYPSTGAYTTLFSAGDGAKALP